MLKLLNNFMKNKSQFLLAVILVSAIIGFLFINFLLIPQIMKVTDLLSKAGKSRADIKSANLEVARIPELKKKIDTFRDKVDSYEKMLPAEREIPTLLEDLSAMAKRSKVKIVGIVPVTQAAKTDIDKKGQIYQEIPILISAKSGYHDLGAFIGDLENSRRFMKIVDISMKTSKASPVKHDVELIVCTYILLKGAK